MDSKIREFLLRHDMCLNDAKQSIDTFVAHGKKGLAGEESSLLMIPTYVKAVGQVPKNQPVIVIDAGGTNLRIALAYFADDGSCVLEDERHYPMPGTQDEISADDFFAAIAKSLVFASPIPAKSRRIWTES
jgi:hexokinase